VKRRQRHGWEWRPYYGKRGGYWRKLNFSEVLQESIDRAEASGQPISRVYLGSKEWKLVNSLTWQAGTSVYGIFLNNVKLLPLDGPSARH
jgi:hypothetical protein